MSFDNDGKRQVMQRFLKAKEKVHALEFELLLQGRDDDAAMVREAGNRVSDEIDRLLKQIMEEWLGEAKDVELELRAKNRSLQASISEIRKKVRTAQNVVKALGYVDDIVAIGAKLLPIA